MSKRSCVQRVTDSLLIAGFAVAIALPLAGEAFRLRIGPDLIEQRKLAQAPVWRRDSLLKLPARFERFYDDHFVFRNTLIRAHNILKRGIMRVSSKDVLIGKEGRLFYRPDTFDDFRGLSPLTPAGVESWRTTVAGRTAWFGERSIPYLLVLAPNQSTVYPEYLPDYIRVNKGRTRREELLELVQRCPTLCFLDPTAALFAAKPRGPVYSPQGTHWSGWGSYTVYREVLQRLSQRRPDLTAPPPGDFVVGNAASGYDLLDLLGLPRPNPRTLSAEPIVPRMGWHAHPVGVTVPRPLTDIGFSQIWALENERGHGCLLAMGDSFLYENIGFSRLLAEHFRRSVFVVRTSTYEALAPLVSLSLFAAQEHPDFVVEEVVERNLGKVTSPGRSEDLETASP